MSENLSRSHTRIALGFGLEFDDLYDRDGLKRLDEIFVDFVNAADSSLAHRLKEAREHLASLPRKDESQLLLDVATHLDDTSVDRAELESIA